MGSGLDRLYMVGGWALGAIAAALAAWALFFDRSRGRRRCPRCWYDMRGTPGLRCPECGRESRTERRLFKTRRRRRWAVLAVLLGVLAYAVGAVPTYQRGGWVALVPTTALIYLAPVKPDGLTGPGVGRVIYYPGTGPVLTRTQLLANEMWSRLQSGRTARWQSQIFIGRYLSNNKLDVGKRVRLPARWPINENIPVVFTGYNLGPFHSVVRDKNMRWAPETSVWLSPQSKPVSELTVEVGYEKYGLAYRTSRKIPIVIEGTRDELLSPLASPADNSLVQSVLAPQLATSDGKTVLIIRDRSTAAAWTEVNFGLAYTFELRVDGALIGTGSGKADWSRPLWKDWDEVSVSWINSRIEHLNRPGAKFTITIRGDKDAATVDYIIWPFDKPRAACWTGEFTMPLEHKKHPGEAEK